MRSPRAISIIALVTLGVTSYHTMTWVERESVLMGTYIRVQLAAPDKTRGMEIIEDVFDAVRHVDALISSWRDDSELGKLNAAPADSAIPISTELYALLDELRVWSRLTHGAFDPTIGALVDAWDMRGAGKVPDEATLNRALTATGFEHYVLDDTRRTVTKSSQLSWIDAGAFGKGAALRAVASTLDANGVERALVDFGGQVLARGGPATNAAWRIGVADPLRRHRPAAYLSLRHQSAATSAQSERFLDVDGMHLGHLLDPTTGSPVDAWGSVTVVAPDPMIADILSTALFVLGPKAALRWARPRPDIGVLIQFSNRDSVALVGQIALQLTSGHRPARIRAP
ncbi:MAG: FAD:protein FMN transferase [Gemmatimonadales bacterium]